METSTTNLEIAMDRLRSIKITFDDFKLTEWLLEYAMQTAKYQGRNLIREKGYLDELMLGKVEEIYRELEPFYWKEDRKRALLLCHYSSIPELVRSEHRNSKNY